MGEFIIHWIAFPTLSYVSVFLLHLCSVCLAFLIYTPLPWNVRTPLRLDPNIKEHTLLFLNNPPVYATLYLWIWDHPSQSMVEFPGARPLKKIDSTSLSKAETVNSSSARNGLSVPLPRLCCNIDWLDCVLAMCRQLQLLRVNKFSGLIVSKRYCFSPIFPDF